MCVNCVSQLEVTLTKVVLAGAVINHLVHVADPVRRDVRTIAFLRDLDLDPVAILGATVVDRAAAWMPQPRAARWSWAMPMRSHSWTTVQ